MSRPDLQAPSSPCIFDNASPEAATQLWLLAEMHDEHTIGVLTEQVLPRLCLYRGWRGLDVGSGVGTIARWLADTVVPDGRVTALDRHPQHIGEHAAIDICAADIRTVDLPLAAFDLIHARLVFMHLPTRDRVVQRMVSALRPGGILMLSEWDCRNPERMLLHTPVPGGRDAFETFQRFLLDVAADSGTDLGWADRVPLVMRTAGLVDVHSVVHNQLWRGGQPGCLLHACNSLQLADRLTAAGMRPDQLATLRRVMTDPATCAYGYLMYTTIGQRPETTVSAPGIPQTRGALVVVPVA